MKIQRPDQIKALAACVQGPAAFKYVTIEWFDKDLQKLYVAIKRCWAQYQEVNHQFLQLEILFEDVSLAKVALHIEQPVDDKTKGENLKYIKNLAATYEAPTLINTVEDKYVLEQLHIEREGQRFEQRIKELEERSEYLEAAVKKLIKVITQMRGE